MKNYPQSRQRRAAARVTQKRERERTLLWSKHRLCIHIYAYIRPGVKQQLLQSFLRGGGGGGGGFQQEESSFHFLAVIQ